MKKIKLKPKRESSLRRFHPWVFSGAIAGQEVDIQEGDWVEVHSHGGDFLGCGHFQKGSITVRVLSFSPIQPDAAFWEKRLLDAFHYRKSLLLGQGAPTNCYRLIHAEGDGLPGLIVDIYDKVAVIQCHSVGMHRDRMQLAEALFKLEELGLQAVYDKSSETLPTDYGRNVQNQYLLGTYSTPVEVVENGCIFEVDWVTGQKTGFFLDQRENRALLAHYVKGKRVLNAFSYSGGFSIYALKAGAHQVDSVDVSGKAIDMAIRNAHLNGFEDTQHRGITSDVHKFLQQEGDLYDVMVVDPPAFAKSLEKRHNAVQGYKRLNALAMSRIKPGGILFTFSCSQVVDRQLFYDTMVAAALEASRQVRVMHILSQPPDHPVQLFHPEGSYLKGLVLYVE